MSPARRSASLQGLAARGALLLAVTTLMLRLCASCAPRSPAETSAPDVARPVAPVRTPDGVLPGVESSSTAQDAAPRGPTPPRSCEEARIAWNTRDPRARRSVVQFFGTVPSPDEAQARFDLVREISVNSPPGASEGAVEAASAVCEYLLGAPDGNVSLPGEALRPPWHVVLRLVAGTRTREEIAATLAAAAERELSWLETTTDQPVAFSHPLRNAIYALGYLHARDHTPVVVRACELACADAPRATVTEVREDAVVALNALGQVGRRADAAIVLHALETAVDPRTTAAAANALEALLGDEATPTLAAMIGQRPARFALGAVLPGLQLSTPALLEALVARRDQLENATDSDDRTLVRLVDSQLARYAEALGVTPGALRSRIEEDPSGAASAMRPFARRMTELAAGEEPLRPEQLEAVLDAWTEARTIYTDRWSWVRDRHIVATAGAKHLPRLERVRIAILSIYRTTCVQEAEIVQRIHAAVERRIAPDRLLAPGTR